MSTLIAIGYPVERAESACCILELWEVSAGPIERQ